MSDAGGAGQAYNATVVVGGPTPPGEVKLKRMGCKSEAFDCTVVITEPETSEED